LPRDISSVDSFIFFIFLSLWSGHEITAQGYVWDGMGVDLLTYNKVSLIDLPLVETTKYDIRYASDCLARLVPTGLSSWRNHRDTEALIDYRCVQIHFYLLLHDNTLLQVFVSQGIIISLSVLVVSIGLY